MIRRVGGPASSNTLTFLVTRDMLAIRETFMTNTYTAVVMQDGKFWIGWIEEVPGVNCQAESREELLETLQVTLGEAIRLNREYALREAREGYQEEKVTV